MSSDRRLPSLSSAPSKLDRTRPPRSPAGRGEPAKAARGLNNAAQPRASSHSAVHAHGYGHERKHDRAAAGPTGAPVLASARVTQPNRVIARGDGGVADRAWQPRDLEAEALWRAMIVACLREIVRRRGCPLDCWVEREPGEPRVEYVGAWVRAITERLTERLRDLADQAPRVAELADTAAAPPGAACAIDRTQGRRADAKNSSGDAAADDQQRGQRRGQRERAVRRRSASDQMNEYPPSPRGARPG